MFDKLIRKSGKAKKETLLDADSGIRVLKINKRRFVVGLRWQTIKYQANMMKAVKNIGKQKNLDVVAIRKSDAYQAGFAPKTKLKLRGGYSLSVSLASLLDVCCIVVIKVGETPDGNNEYTLIGRTPAGSIHPDSDNVLQDNDLYQSMIDMKAQLRGNDENLDIPILGELDSFDWITEHLDLEAVLSPGKLDKDFKLKPLTMGMTDERIMVLAAALLMSLAAVFFINQYREGQEALKKQRQVQSIEAQNELNRKARYQTALENLNHPWATKPSVSNFLAGCREVLSKLEPSIEGWIPVQALCSENTMVADYLRPQNSVATTAKFIDAIKKKFGVGVAFNYANTSLTNFIIGYSSIPDGDDPMEAMGSQLVRMISLFQSLNIDASFTPVEIKDKLKNEYGEDLPLQEWQEYGFKVTTGVSPQLIFKGDNFKGIRLKTILYKIDANGSFIYDISGVIYGKRPKESYPTK